MNRTVMPVTCGKRQRHSMIAILLTSVLLVESCNPGRGPHPSRQSSRPRSSGSSRRTGPTSRGNPDIVDA